MKKYTIFALFTAIFIFSACGDDSNPNPPPSDGQIQSDGGGDLPNCLLDKSGILAYMYSYETSRLHISGDESSAIYDMSSSSWPTFAVTVFKGNSTEAQKVGGVTIDAGGDFGFHLEIYGIKSWPGKYVKLSASLPGACKTNSMLLEIDYAD